MVDQPARNQNTLDLIITNLPSKISITDTNPGISSSHDAVFTEIDVSPVTHKQVPRNIPLYKQARWDSMRSDSQELDKDIRQMAPNR